MKGDKKAKMKTVKIDTEVHKKVKVFCVETGNNITEFTNEALLAFLSSKMSVKKK
jgi:hypothetical protein